MGKSGYPITPAVRFLRAEKVDFKGFVYPYADHGGTRQAAAQLKVPEERVIKTVVMETGDDAPLLVLMHGNRAVSTRQLARVIRTKTVAAVRADKTVPLTGYPVGGISPFGTRRILPVYVQRTVLDLETIFINGGKRGFLVEIEPAVLITSLSAIAVDVAAEPS
jgi:Cys-tRNA(Pro) deacylase